MARTSCVETVDFKLIVQILIQLERFLETEVNFGKYMPSKALRPAQLPGNRVGSVQDVI